MMIFKFKRSIFYQIIGASMLFGCASWNNTEKGVAVGGGAGAAIGAVLGNKSGQVGKGAGIGAVVGGAAGAAVGIYMDKQAKKMEEIKDAEVERVGEAIKLTFDSGILFGFDSFSLTPDAQESIMKLSEILNEYPETNISIEGHTDNRGAYAYNQKLSEQRAQSVRNYLKMKGVEDNRLFTIGHSFDKPIATNETDEGRAKNRRVEVLITATDVLIEKAEKGEIEN